MTNYLSVEGKRQLEERKNNLIEKRRQISRDVGRDKLKSDSSNTSFMSGTRELQRLRRIIEDIDELIKEAEIICLDDVRTDEVAVGSVVTVVFSDGTECEYIVGLSDPQCNKISTDAPLGKNILGAKVGETVRYSVQNRQIEVRIQEIKEHI